MKTPIEVWPPQTLRGSPGYSAGHYSSLAGAAEDPLRVAERILAHVENETINREALSRCGGGEPFETVMAWQTRQLGRASVARWERLCNSFDEVLAALKSAPQTPVMKALVRQAKAARKAGQ